MLSSEDLQFASYVEQVYRLRGDLPSRDNCREVLIFVSARYYENRMRNAEFQEHLENLGVPIKRIINDLPPGALTIEQLRCINTLLDFNDTRSDKSKLKDLGIKTNTYQAWKKDPAFQNYISQRALNLIGDNIDEVDRALFDQARSGEISAIKFLYEVTGKYDPKRNDQLNAKELITLIIDILTQEIKDPELLQRIATRMQLMITGNKLGNQNFVETVARQELTG